MKKSNPNNVNRKNTKRGILICLLLLIMAICTGTLSIHAYFTDSDTVFNDFTVGNNVIEIADKTTVTVTNKNVERAIPCYIRVFVAKEDGSTLPATDTTGDEAHWIDGDDDYYYYRTVVQPGETTAALFKAEVSGTSEDNKLIVYAESIQAEAIVKENPTPQKAFATKGGAN